MEYFLSSFLFFLKEKQCFVGIIILIIITLVMKKCPKICPFQGSTMINSCVTSAEYIDSIYTLILHENIPTLQCAVHPLTTSLMHKG